MSVEKRKKEGTEKKKTYRVDDQSISSSVESEILNETDEKKIKFSSHF